jgi:hypothetical protein
MEIKRTQPGQANWNRTSETEAKKPAGPAEETTLGPAAGTERFQAIRGEFKRADLSTGRFQAILEKSIDALLDSTVERMGSGLPDGAREKISALLAADPLFSKRVFVYWDKNLN